MTDTLVGMANPVWANTEEWYVRRLEETLDLLKPGWRYRRGIGPWGIQWDPEGSSYHWSSLAHELENTLNDLIKWLPGWWSGFGGLPL